MLRKPCLYFTAVLYILLFTHCGIPSFPYLYPPEVLTAAGYIEFQHDDDNDPNVFEGYEIYYRIYEPGISETQILADLSGYFNGISAFRDVSDDGTIANFNKKYRRVLLYNEDKSVNFNELEGGMPHMPVSSVDCGIDFSVQFLADNDGFLQINFIEGYLGSNDVLYGFRNIGVSDITSSPFFRIAEYTTTDFDVNSAEISDFSGGLEIAFFAVPYGMDDITQIFANNTSEDMRFLGTITAN